MCWVELLHDGELGFGEALGGEEDGAVGVPLEPGAVEERGAEDGDLADGGGEGGAGADGAEEGVPACERDCE